MDELKPCPFCGWKAEVKICDGSGSFYTDIVEKAFSVTKKGRQMTHCLVRCERCGVRTEAHLTRRGAFKAWNRRANDEK